jgi:hypothetical protein
MFMRVESSFDYLELGSFEAAAQQVREAEHIAESVDLVYFRALAEMAGGCLHLYRGAPALAIPMLERSLKRGDDADFPGAPTRPCRATPPRANACTRRIAPVATASPSTLARIAWSSRWAT